MPDWIDRYVEVTEGISSPEIFRLWSAISAVAGSLERRVWASTTIGRCYANLYIMLVAPPGVGKTQAITPISNIWLQQDTLCVAPESMTKAALIDTLINSRQIVMLPDNNMLEYSALQISVSELGVLVSSHDLEFLAVVNRAFDNDKVMREQRRHVNNGKELQITNPYVNILAGAQPGFLGSVLPEEAWVMGTTSRFIMVFAGEGTNFDIFGEFIDRDPMYADLAEQMKPWTKLYGQCRWEDKAVAAMRKLHIAGPNTFPPVPTAPKLQHYLTRRTQFLIKLTVVSAISRTGDIVLDEFDVERARHWLLSAEATMPNIFTAMNVKTDAQLVDEMHVLAWKVWKQTKFTPLSQAFFYDFLRDRVYSERIPKIMDMMERSGLIKSLGEGLYRPEARLDLGQSVFGKTGDPIGNI